MFQFMKTAAIVILVCLTIPMTADAADPVGDTSRTVPGAKSDRPTGPTQTDVGGRPSAPLKKPAPEMPGSQGTTDAGAPEPKPDALQKQYTKILQNMLQGLSEGDYTKFVRNLSDQMRAAQNRQTFLQLQKNMQKNLGKMQSMVYLGFYSQGGYNMAMFKARFAKDKDDVLITLVFDRKAADPKVNGLWMDSPVLAK